MSDIRRIIIHISPLASWLFVPEESVDADAVPMLGVQWQLFGIRGLVGPNGAAALTNSHGGYRNEGTTARGARICLKFQSESPQGSSVRARWPKLRCDLPIRHVQKPIRLSRSRLVKSRRPDPPEITPAFPFFGSFIGPTRDKRVCRAADLTPGDLMRRALRSCCASKTREMLIGLISPSSRETCQESIEFSYRLLSIVHLRACLILFRFPVYACGYRLLFVSSSRDWIIMNYRNARVNTAFEVDSVALKLNSRLRCWAAAVFGVCIASEHDAAPVIKAT